MARKVDASGRKVSQPHGKLTNIVGRSLASGKLTEGNGTTPGHMEREWKLTESLPAAFKVDKFYGRPPGCMESSWQLTERLPAVQKLMEVDGRSPGRTKSWRIETEGLPAGWKIDGS